MADTDCAHLCYGADMQPLCAKNCRSRIRQPRNELFAAIGCGVDCSEYAKRPKGASE